MSWGSSIVGHAMPFTGVEPPATVRVPDQGINDPPKAARSHPFSFWTQICQVMQGLNGKITFLILALLGIAFFLSRFF